MDVVVRRQDVHERTRSDHREHGQARARGAPHEVPRGEGRVELEHRHGQEQRPGEDLARPRPRRQQHGREDEREDHDVGVAALDAEHHGRRAQCRRIGEARPGARARRHDEDRADEEHDSDPDPERDGAALPEPEERRHEPDLREVGRPVIRVARVHRQHGDMAPRALPRRDHVPEVEELHRRRRHAEPAPAVMAAESREATEVEHERRDHHEPGPLPHERGLESREAALGDVTSATTRPHYDRGLP